MRISSVWSSKIRQVLRIPAKITGIKTISMGKNRVTLVYHVSQLPKYKLFTVTTNIFDNN